jgi:TPR repeat protein
MAFGPALAADVGGWFAEQQKAAAQDATTPTAASCPQIVARAATDPTALGAYHAAHCYLQADAPDLVAAKAWLARSAEMDFPPAHRLLRALQAAENGSHSSVRHCHDLGEGRQICHGGGSALPLAATTTK